jgi:IS5 family transposase
VRQHSLSDDGFEMFRNKTRKEPFLEEINYLVPWSKLTEAIEPYYPKPEGAGRRPIGIERMLRIYFLQHCFNLSDPAAENTLYHSRALRHFAGIDLGREPVLDETTICKFRHPMEKHNPGDQLFHQVNQYRKNNGIKVSRGNFVDASSIHAPSSTKNKMKAHDPDLHQARKGNQWYFGMKTHIVVDTRTKLIHSVVATAANVHDSLVLRELLHGNDWNYRRVLPE